MKRDIGKGEAECFLRTGSTKTNFTDVTKKLIRKLSNRGHNKKTISKQIRQKENHTVETVVFDKKPSVSWIRTNCKSR